MPEVKEPGRSSDGGERPLPCEGQSWIVASMVKWRDWLVFSHLEPFSFPRVMLHDHGRDPLNRLSGHTSPAARRHSNIVGQNTRYQG
jgi:hypothetical protein